MSEKNQKDTVDLILSIIICVQIPLALYYQSFVIIKIWNWLNADKIPFTPTYTFCIMAQLILGILQIKPMMPTKDISTSESLKHIFFWNYFYSTVCLSIAWLTKYFISQ